MDELRAQLMRLGWSGIAAVIVVACSDGQATTVTPAVPAGVVDSIIEPPAAIARFVGGVTRPSGFNGGAADIEGLIESLMVSLSRNDTTAVVGMLLTRAEYGYLYYPTSMYARPPYQLPPEIAWMLSAEASAKGLRRMFARYGGEKLEVLGHTCLRVEKEGKNDVHSECTVTFRPRDGGSLTRRLFRSLIVTNGQAKFLSYSGDF